MAKKDKKEAKKSPATWSTLLPPLCSTALTDAIAARNATASFNESSSASTKKKYVVGVDFGTTFTSVAFASTTLPHEVKLVQTWPSGNTGDSSADQVPTEIHYTNPTARTRVWGYEVSAAARESGAALKWFKLLLQRQMEPSTSFPEPVTSRLLPQRRVDIPRNPTVFEIASYARSNTPSGHSPTFTPSETTPVDTTAERLRRLNLLPVNVVADFLASVRTVTVESIQRTYGIEWVAEDDMMYGLTVPAIWSDSAKSLMVQAAEKAGFGRHRKDFNLVSEPEAAAAYTLKAIQASDLKPRDTFVVCDAGGGTVDLISYTIAEVDPLRLDETVSSSGGLCGSVYLDERFEQYIRRVFGDDVVNSMKPRSKAEMMRTWESNVKFKFGNSSSCDGYEVTIPGVPDDEKKAFEDGFHNIEYSEVKKIFDPVIDKVVELVSQQVRCVLLEEDEVKAILLVGGFGTSHYLLERLKAAKYEGRSIQVLQPVNARSAIARGALLRGLDGSIVNQKRAPRHYGSAANTTYTPGQGTEGHRFFCRTEECYKVPDKMNWYVKKNAIVGKVLTVTLEMYRLIPIVQGQEPNFVLTHDLLASDIDDAPDYRWQNPNAVYKVCTLRVDLSTIPARWRFTKQHNSLGQEFYNIPFKLKMTLVGEVLYFELLFEGARCGDVVAEYW